MQRKKNVQQEYGSYVVGWCLCSRAQSSATGLGYLERKSWSPKAGLLLLAQQEAQDTRQISRFRRECMCIPPAPFAPAPSERQAGLWQIGQKRHFCPFFSGKPRLCQVFIFVSLVVPGPAERCQRKTCWRVGVLCACNEGEIVPQCCRNDGPDVNPLTVR